MKFSYQLTSFLILAVSLSFTNGINAQIVFNNDAVSIGTTSNTLQTTLSNFQAKAGNNRLLVVNVSTLNFAVESQITNVTYNGLNMEKANGLLSYNQGSAVSHSEIWVLVLGSGSAITGDVVATVDKLSWIYTC